MSDDRIIIGTRGSDLARTQSDMVQRAIETAFPGICVEQSIIQTVGDKRPDLKLSEFSQGAEPVDKGIFTRELEIALRNAEIDLAVHSLKDVPTLLDDGFEIGGVLERAPIEDVLISKTPGGLSELREAGIVATSSVRRAKQIQWHRRDLTVVDIRGNVATRVRKLAESTEWSATLLARAGLERLGLLDENGGFNEWSQLFASTLPADQFLPAASQGAVGIEIRSDVRGSVRSAIEAINHGETFTCVTAEREFLRLLGAGCQTPVGIRSEFAGNTLGLQAVVFEDAPEPRRASVSGAAQMPHAVALALFEALA
jgi:hydroxymethylbilane synthase